MNMVDFKYYNNTIIGFINDFISIDEVLEKLLSIEFKNQTTIILDSLLYYGNTSQRYSRIDIDNGKLISFEFVDIDKNHPIRIISLEYFYNNKHLLKNSTVDCYSRNLINRRVIV